MVTTMGCCNKHLVMGYCVISLQVLIESIEHMQCLH